MSLSTIAAPLQIALRTYSLCLSLTLGPVLLPTAHAIAVNPKNLTARARVLWRALVRELQPTGFASAMTAAVAGGAALQQLWNLLARRWAWIRSIESKLSLFQRTLLTNVISSTLAVALFRWKRHRRRGAVSPTLDLSLLFLVRALDASVQMFLIGKAREIATRQVQVDTKSLDKRSEDVAKAWQDRAAMHLDTLVFWASSARLMWCFFYQPQRLPFSLVKRLGSLANVDKRLLEVLRGLREGTWTYAQGLEYDIAGSLAEELGRPPSWGDPAVLPAYGGDAANEVWKELEVDGRGGIGGMPCELVHGGIGATFGLQNSCFANAAIRAMYAFIQGFVLHLPVHFLPILLAKPSTISHPHRPLSALLSAIRSATFVSTFVSSCWFTVCCTRTLILPRLFPMVSHAIWDGPYGGTLISSLVSGASIFVENGKRRREVALYALPKALRASIPDKWLRGGHPLVECTECLAFVVSLASLLTFSTHQPESLRGLSRWTLAFIMKGLDTEGKPSTSPRRSDSPIPPPADCGHHKELIPSDHR